MIAALADNGSSASNGRNDKALKVAIVDDYDADIFFLNRLLNRRGIQEIDRYTNGHDFLTALSEGAFYDLVFLDIRMPNLDGFQIQKAVREAYPAQIRETYMISASAQLRDSSEIEKIPGIKALLRKPVTAKTLDAVFGPDGTSDP